MFCRTFSNCPSCDCTSALIRVENPAIASPKPNRKNGQNGSPVKVGPVTAKNHKNPEARNRAFGLLTICPVTSVPNELAAEERVINTPAAIDIKSEGTCEAKPSPIVRIVYFETASAIGIWFIRQPIHNPPIMLIKTIIIPAIVSPFTNFIAPSILPKRFDSLCRSSRFLVASSGEIKPALKSASIVICLPGIASNANLAATSAIRSAPFVITMN